VLRSLAQANREPGRGTIFVVVSLLNLIMRPLTRRDWRGQDKIPQTGGGVIFVANHISNADPLALGQFLAFSGRWPRFLAKASLFRYPVLGHILRACGQIPVQRQSAQSADALLAAVEALRQSRAVVIYPEGTITRDPDLWPMEGKTGAARIALRTGCPVIPIGQWGAQELMYGREIHFPRLLPRKTLRLIAGDAVPLDDLREAPVTAAVLDAATTRIMDAITALVAELRQEPPPAQRFDPQRPAPDRGDRS
jgi:1-acyl-sn-glycerol-3-phosphate acyltransferase